MRSTNRSSQQGFSLLEMVVAIAILALSLGALYQAVSGASRNVRTNERYAYGVELARSLLAEHSIVPKAGLSGRGETAGGFTWQVVTTALPGRGKKLPPGSLHTLEITVSWQDGRKRRQVILHSIAQGMIGT
jgi:general secretion pathway protein I